MTTTPLPAASASSFTTYGAPKSSSAASTSAAVVQVCEPAVGTPAAAITSLANALEPSSCAAAPDGPKTAIPRAAHGVGDAGDQRRLGTDDDQVDAEPLGQVRDRLTRHRVDVVQRGDGGDARVARGGVHLGHRRVTGQGEGERVLAAAGSDDESPHGPQP